MANCMFTSTRSLVYKMSMSEKKSKRIKPKLVWNEIACLLFILFKKFLPSISNEQTFLNDMFNIYFIRLYKLAFFLNFEHLINTILMKPTFLYIQWTIQVSNIYTAQEVRNSEIESGDWTRPGANKLYLFTSATREFVEFLPIEFESSLFHHGLKSVHIFLCFN